MENVLVVNFGEDAKAYEALSRLKELDDQQQLNLAGAAVVVRDEGGQVETKDEVGDTGYSGTATGGIIGLIVGIIGGPFGVLLGGATGLLIGSLYDLDDAVETESVLSDISRSVRPGHPALLAEVSEPSPDVVDAAMGQLGGTVLRRTLEDVEAEIAAAQDAQRAATREARRRLHEERRAQIKEKVHEKIEELKAKLHRSRPVGAGSS
jgi:uncharacterized membrane protein